MKVAVEIERVKEQEGGVQFLFTEYLGRGLAALGVVLAREVPPALIGGEFLEEVASSAKEFEVEDLLLDRRVAAFDIGVSVGRGGGQEAVGGAAAAHRGGVADFAQALLGAAVLRAVVGRQRDGLGLDPPGLEVGEDALGAEGGIGRGEGVGVVDEERAALDVDVGVLVLWQAAGLHLRPVGGNVVERLGVGLQALEGPVAGLDGAQVVLFLMLLAALARQAALAKHARDRALGRREAEEVLEAPGAETRGLLASLENLLFVMGRGLVGAGLGGARFLDKSGAAALLEAPQPLAHGVSRTLEGAGGVADAVLPGVHHERQAHVKVLVIGSDHGVVVHGNRGVLLLGLCFGELNPSRLAPRFPSPFSAVSIVSCFSRAARAARSAPTPCADAANPASPGTAAASGVGHDVPVLALEHVAGFLLLFVEPSTVPSLRPAYCFAVPSVGGSTIWRRS